MICSINKEHQMVTNIGDDMGWKSKLKIPPKDNRFKTSVSTTKKLYVYHSYRNNYCLF